MASAPGASRLEFRFGRIRHVSLTDRTLALRLLEREKRIQTIYFGGMVRGIEAALSDTGPLPWRPPAATPPDVRKAFFEFLSPPLCDDEAYQRGFALALSQVDGKRRDTVPAGVTQWVGWFAVRLLEKPFLLSQLEALVRFRNELGDIERA